MNLRELIEYVCVDQLTASWGLQLYVAPSTYLWCDTFQSSMGCLQRHWLLDTPADFDFWLLAVVKIRGCPVGDIIFPGQAHVGIVTQRFRSMPARVESIIRRKF